MINITENLFIYSNKEKTLTKVNKRPIPAPRSTSTSKVNAYQGYTVHRSSLCYNKYHRHIYVDCVCVRSEVTLNNASSFNENFMWFDLAHHALRLLMLGWQCAM